MKKIILLGIFFGTLGFSVKAQDPNILIGLGSPAYGVKMKINYPGQTTGWARAFSITNEDDSQQFIKFGAQGGIANGVSTFEYGFIGKEYNDAYMAFRPTGFVGVGTINPDAFVHVNANNGHYANDGSKSTFKLSYSNTTYANHYIGSAWNYFIDNPYSGSSQGGIHFKTAGSNRMSISQDGNVGVGTTNPTNNFTLYGSSYVKSLVQSSDNHAYYVVQGAAGSGSFVDFNRTGDGRLWHTGLRNDSDNFEFRLNDQSVVMSMTQSENVGIGTRYPDQKLTVAGTVKSKEIIVEETAGADFVFEEDYDLPSLAQIEQFIKANKHLEGIASAKEMKANGVKVGELQIQLLQKIEELTLHMINLQKQNNTLKKEIKELKKNKE